MSHNGQHAPSPDRRTRRIRMVVVVATIGAIALAIGLFLGSRSDGGGGSATPSPMASATPSPSAEPTSSGEPTPAEEPTSTEEPAVASGFADGRHFVLARSVKPGDVLVADLGYFFTGDEANEAAAQHGVETPVPNDYFIVNDNPKIRRVPISTDATVRYIPSESCCDLQPWDLQTWIDAVNGEVQTDMMGEMSSTWWWITVRGGAVVAIEQQYIP